jgi:hypothetical protein
MFKMRMNKRLAKNIFGNFLVIGSNITLRPVALQHYPFGIDCPFQKFILEPPNEVHSLACSKG